MGLDAVELLMAVEEKFGVMIPDHIAEKMETVGDMYNIFWQKIEDVNKSKCLSQLIFYRLRKYFRSQFDIPDEILIRPDSLLEDIIPVENRYELCMQLQTNCEYNLPKWCVYQKKEVLFLKIPMIFSPKVVIIGESDMRELVNSVIGVNYKKRDFEVINRLALEEIINNIIVDKLGIRLKEIGPEKSFVKDLGVD